MAAWLLDALFTTALTFVVLLPLVLVIVVAAQAEAGPLAVGAGVLTLLAYVGLVLLGLAYPVVCEGSPLGQTYGKHLLGLRVVRADLRGPLGYGTALGRLLAKWLSGIPCYLGYLWAFWDEERRGWHDMLVDSRVIDTDEPKLGPIDFYRRLRASVRAGRTGARG